MQKEELIERLLRLDEDASLIYDNDDRFHLVIVGGGALLLTEKISRATHDIDALDASREIRGLLERYDINCQVQTYINNFPYNYDTRLKRLPIGGKKIDFYTASLEDIVIAKLYSYREKDLRDVESPAVLKNLDWALLHKLATAEDEAKASALNDRNYSEFRQNYDDYVRKFRPCEN